MPATSVKPRLAQIALVAIVGFIALSVAMCHSGGTASNTGTTAKPTVTATPRSPAAGAG